MHKKTVQLTMKRIALIIVMIGTLAPAAFGGSAALDTQKAKDSYSLGYSFGRNLVVQEVDIDEAVLLTAIRDALNNKKPVLGEQDIDDTMKELRRKVYALQQQHIREQAAKNLQEANSFLETNGKKKGVVTLASGLQYAVIAEGKGAGPKSGDGVRVRYRGTLANGTEFDNTMDFPDGDVPVIPVAGANKGWTEALQLMKPGAKWRLFVPPHLGFGDRPAGRIPANSVLIYDMELLSVVDRTGANEASTGKETKN